MIANDPPQDPRPHANRPGLTARVLPRGRAEVGISFAVLAYSAISSMIAMGIATMVGDLTTQAAQLVVLVTLVLLAGLSASKVLGLLRRH
jgi:hypothetical protein